MPIPSGTDALHAELGLQRANHRAHDWGDDPGSKSQRACLTHEVMMRMLESAETLAPFLRLDTEVVFGLLRNLVIEEGERSPFGSVAVEGGAGAMMPGRPRQDLPRALEWAVALDAEQENEG